MSELKKLRDKIDAIDDEILALLNKRANIVLDVAHAKRKKNAKFYSPEREKEILQRLTSFNKGPFPNDALKTIFREILSASLSLEEPLVVAYLGPQATFTHLAALRYFGSSADFIPVEGIGNIFEHVNTGKADFGVVPVENSNEGVVSYTLDMFVDYDLKVAGEIVLEISHSLMSLSGDKSKIRKIYSHPQPAAQCRRWLEVNMPGIRILEATSTAMAAKLASQAPDSAAIASEVAAKVYDLSFVERHIEDSKNNFTRFLVISKESPKKTGRDKTSLVFSTKDRPGALYEILQPFRDAKINLTKIESRPSRKKAWEYIFFVDMEGHTEDKKLKNAIEEVKEGCLYLKVLGSYPAGDIAGDIEI